MKEIYLAHWKGDDYPEFASQTFEGLLTLIDERYGNTDMGKRIFLKSYDYLAAPFYGSVLYENEEERDSIKILCYKF